MKKKLFYLAIAVITGFLFSFNIFSQQNSLWLRNLSESIGAPVTGYEDFATEIASSGNVVHTLWLTWKGDMKELNYRRSPDNGLTWAPKVTLFEDNLDYDRRYRRMAVSGNYVHIVVNENAGTDRQLLYFRSTDGGATFEPAKVLYSTQFWIYQVNIDAEGAKVRISMAEDCHFCATKKWIYLIKSDDNGANFENKLVTEDVYGAYTDFTSLTISGQNIYLLYRKGIGYWANYDFELRLLSSSDGGNNFTDQVLSQPAMSGEHHVFQLLDFNNVYNNKIAVDGNKIWVVWSGWDETNTPTIFVRHSANAGATFGPLKKISGTLTIFQAGLETIAARGNNVYVALNTTNALIYKNQSNDGGNTFSGFTEFTRPNSNYLRNAVEPQLYIDPDDNGAWLIATGAIMGKLLPDGNEIRPSYYGYWGFNTSRRPRLAVSSSGFLHLIMESGGEWTQTGGFTDLNLWYRRINLNPTDPGQGNQALNMDIIPNPGDGSGVSRFDNMIIGPELGKQFSNAMTIEFWVKPDAINDYKKMLTQYRAGTWNMYEPVAFQLWASLSNEPVAGLSTSTGNYVLPGIKKLTTGFWNHLAVTYQHDGSAGNFKILLNGQVTNQITATGIITDSDALWILGCVQNYYNSDGFKGSIEELRFWNVARTPEQIRNNRFVQLQGNEPGLTAYYRFDGISPFGEITDLTGLRHTGRLMYKEEAQPSNIKDLALRFSYTQTVSSFTFQQESDGAESFQWDFGNGQTSDFVNPSVTYATPGNYNVCLSAFGNDMYDTYCEEVQVHGIDRIYPAQGGNTDYLTMYIYGGGFNANNVVKLRRSGFSDIVAQQTIFDEKKTLTALFDLAQKEVGVWDVVIANGPQEMILPASFSIVPGEVSAPFVNYNGGGRILFNRWTPQTITIGNSANVDAHGVLLWVTIPEAPGNDIAFLNLNLLPPQVAIDHGNAAELEALGPYIVVDSLFGKANHSRVYTFYFPILPAKSSFDIAMRIKVGQTSNKVPVNVWLSGPFYHSPLSAEVQGCVALSTAKAFIKAGLSFVPGVACVSGAMAVASDYLNDSPPTPSAFEKLDTRSWGWILGSNLLECASSLYGGSVLTGILTIITSGVENTQENADCYSGFRQVGWLDILYYPVWSFDPNEKAGLPGFTAQGYIGQQSRMGYQVRFENKSTATAPAHEVVILDTLTFGKIDFENFSFGPFGWGDTILFPLHNARQFSMDVDMRPEKDVIVRVTGELYETEKVVKWSFLSLDPETLDLVWDPDGGFLPPNLTSPEGEGFVNFTIGMADGILNKEKIENRATILFDSNEPILTNLHLNTFDLQAPDSKLSLSASTTTDTLITLQLQASDAESQVRHVEIWVSENDSAYVFSHNDYGNSTPFVGKYGSTYKFYSIAVDSAGNRELPPAVADAAVSVLTGTQERFNLSQLRVYPQPTREEVVLEFELPAPQRITMKLEDLTGRQVQRLMSADLQSGFYRIPLRLSVQPGVYFIKIENGEGSKMIKIVVAR